MRNWKWVENALAIWMGVQMDWFHHSVDARNVNINIDYDF